MVVENWDTRLVEYALSVVGEDFEWGRTDCATITREALTLVFGEDPWDGHARRWTTKVGAVRAGRAATILDVLRGSGAIQVGEHFGTSGDVALGCHFGAHGLPMLSILLPGRKVLTSTPESGVVILDKLDMDQGTVFWRYPGLG